MAKLKCPHRLCLINPAEKTGKLGKADLQKTSCKPQLSISFTLKTLQVKGSTEYVRLTLGAVTRTVNVATEQKMKDSSCHPH